MRKNIFIKSMLRQPLRTALLVVLIGLASFAFVLRTTEFIIVRQQIYATAAYYRTLGQIHHASLFGDVTEGIERLANATEIDLFNTRRAAEGIMTDVLNADFGGMDNRLVQMWGARLTQPRLNETFFYAYILRFHHGGHGGMHNIEVEVCKVLTGHPEYIVPGQRMFLQMRGVGMNYPGALDSLSAYNEGQRFFFRGIYTRIMPYEAGVFGQAAAHGPLMPMVFDGRTRESFNNLHLWPLNWAGERIHEQIWYWPAPTGTEVDFTLPELAHLPGEIKRVNRDLRSMQLQTTRNMEVMPEMGRVFELMEGRLINDDDYINNRKVAVIDQSFAVVRGVEVGDTLTFQVPFEQHFSGAMRLPGIALPLVRVEREYTHRYEAYYELTVEVVGITRFSILSRLSERSLLVFIPDSVLPDELGILWRQFDFEGELDPIAFGIEHQPDVWFSFTLADARDEEAFSDANRYVFELLDGMDLVIHYANAGYFWASAGPILLSITFNAALFWLVLALVLGLVAFLFIRQRRKDFAIMRTLGISAKRVYLLLLIAALLFSIPAVIVGSYFGWQMALGEAEYTLLAFEDVYDEALPVTPFEVQWMNFFGEMPPRGAIDGRREVNLAFVPDNELFLLLMGVIFTALMLFILLGGFSTLRLPVLAQLQGGLGRRQKTKPPKASLKKETPTHDRYMRPNLGIGLMEIKNTNMVNALRSIFRYITRHTFRAPMKSGLGVLIAVFFMVFLGWLHNSILQTESEIEHIYDTWVVQASITPVQDAGLYTEGNYFFNTFIRPAAVARIRATEYLYTEYLEAPFERSIIIPVAEDGGVPFNWRRLAGLPHEGFPTQLVRMLGIYNHTLGISCLVEFEQRNSLSAGLFHIWEHHQGDETLVDAVIERSLGGISITFYEGFDKADFNGLTPSGHIPVVVSDHLFAQRGFALGDIAILGYANIAQRWGFAGVQIVGKHNRNIHLPRLSDATLMPLWAAEEHFWGLFYETFDFGIHPKHNRDLNPARFSLLYILSPPYQPPLLELTLYDSELRTVTGALRQILMLLELMFPVVVALAVLIGFGLSVLLMLQNAHNAAILRVLGASGHKARLILWLEQFLLCTVGLVLGLGVLFFLGMEPAMVVVLAGLYLTGYALGALVGAVMITRKPPLDLLQVRE